MRRSIYLVAVVLLAHSWSLSAGTITYSAIASTGSDSFNPPQSTDQFSLTAPPLFVADFSTDKTLQLTFSAPPGYHYSVPALPSGITFPEVTMVLIVGNDSGVNTFFDGGSLSFGNLSGTQPTTASVQFTTYSGGGFSAVAGANITGPFSFTSVTMSLPVPSGFSSSYSTAPGPVSRILISGTDSSDPGQWAFLVPDAVATPEPGPAGLVWLGIAALGGLAWRRRRSTR